MHVGDRIKSPTGTLTVIGFETAAGQTEADCPVVSLTDFTTPAATTSTAAPVTQKGKKGKGKTPKTDTGKTANTKKGKTSKTDKGKTSKTDNGKTSKTDSGKTSKTGKGKTSKASENGKEEEVSMEHAFKAGTGCDICSTNLAGQVNAKTGKTAKKASKNKLTRIDFAWDGASSPTFFVKQDKYVGLTISADNSVVSVNARAQQLPSIVLLSVDGHSVMGRTGKGYETGCQDAQPMRIGDVLSAPTGTLTVIGFVGNNGQTESDCDVLRAGAAPTARATFTANMAGCSVCRTIAKSKVKLQTLTFIWEGSDSVSIKSLQSKYVSITKWVFLPVLCDFLSPCVCVWGGVPACGVCLVTPSLSG